MVFYYFNKHGAKRSADYFMGMMQDAMPSHINVVYSVATDEIVWERRA
jgi:hypothetical protein